MRDMLKKLFPRDYRHYISIFITFGFVACGFLFPNALARFGETLRDLGTSIVYYFYGVYGDGPDVSPIRPTVNAMQKWEFVPSPWEPLSFFPWTWEEFKVLWVRYWVQFASLNNLAAYGLFLSEILAYVAQGISILWPVALLIWLLSKRYTDVESDDPESVNEDSKPLAIFKKFLFKVVYPVVTWIKSFVAFVRKNKRYYQAWIVLWLLHFNVFSICVAALSFLFYLSVSLDFAAVYTQVVKLLIDLTPMIRFLPGVVWFILGYILLDYLCKKIAYKKLEHNERMNRGLLNERGVVTIIYGNMGTGKTRMLTSLALSAEKQLRDQALEILLETDMKFPNFPWVNLRAEVKRRMSEHLIVDVFSIRRWIRAWKQEYFELEKQGKVDKGFILGYDIEHFTLTYNDNLVVSHLFDAIEDYAQAFFVYSIQTSLIFSNYSIRVDFDLTNEGHFPIYNDDFFKRKPEFQHLYSRYCHIIDFDMLRLGKRMLEDNPNKNALGFGVYIVSEIDKERKNELEIKKQAASRKTKKADEDTVEECSQNNDLFNACLKMIRHATVIANRVFVKVLCDLQRPEDWGAGGREVGEVVFIKDKGEKAPVLPFFSPYWLISGLCRIHRIFENFYLDYIGTRDDNTLLLFLFKNVTAVYTRYIDRTEKLFGSQTFNLEVESGRLEGEVKQRKFYGMDKKDFSRRYSTDAMSSIFDLPNTVSIADFIEYSTIMASKYERDLQRSHFQSDINKYIAS